MKNPKIIEELLELRYMIDEKLHAHGYVENKQVDLEVFNDLVQSQFRLIAILLEKRQDYERALLVAKEGAALDWAKY